MQNTSFIYMADVFCPWCYGFGPIMKRIALDHPEIPVNVIGGNLISRPMTIAQDLAANPDLVEFWRSVEKTVNRPLTGAINAAVTGKEVRMFSPAADEILVTLRKFAPDQELDQLLYLEDLFYMQGADLFSGAMLEKIALRWKIPSGQFDKALDSEAARAATKRNLAEATQLLGEGGAYPSLFLAKDGEAFAISQGFAHYETVSSRLERVLKNVDMEPIAHLGCSFSDSCTAGLVRK